MATSHPFPLRARAQQTLMLLVAMFSIFSALSAGAAASAVQPTAMASSTALHRALIVRAGDKRLLGRNSSALTACRHTHSSRCAFQRRRVVRARTKLGHAERLVRSLSARIARRRHSSKGLHTSPPSANGSSANTNGKDVAIEGAKTSGASGNSHSPNGTGTSGPNGANASGTSTSGSNTSDSNKGSTGSTGSGLTGTLPIETPPSSSTPSFQPGLNSGWEPTWDVDGAAQLGAKLVRLDASIDDSPKSMESIVADYAAKGIQVELLADFNASLPTPTEANNLATWAKTFGPGGSFWAKRSDGRLAVKTIEFGNETSYEYQFADDSTAAYASRAQTYALRFKEAATAVSAVNPNVGLLAQGDAGNAGSTWISSMFKAVPNLGQFVTGWTIHPYGPGWRSRFEDLIAETAAQGAPSNIPIDVTEWGLSTDNGNCLTENYGWNACMSYDEAGEVLTRTVSEMRQMLGSRMGLFMLYQVRDKLAPGASDDREEYFGALQHELAPKGGYTTAARALMAS